MSAPLRVRVRYALQAFARLLTVPKEAHVCGRCGGSNIEWKAHVDPNDRLRITWVADDPDDVWCEDCECWGVGSEEAS